VTIVALLLCFVALQRVGELLLARRNTRRLLARGAYEVGAGHYPLIVALHAAWLLGLCWFARDAAIQPAWAAAYLVLQGFRVWILASLGERWTTRIIILPGEPLVRRGPYRLIPHPNYVLVAAEIAVLPLALGLEIYALVFSVLNALVLAVRIRAEGRALAPLR
jgi:methyltransferase